jgi:hypothetical protein
MTKEVSMRIRRVSVLVVTLAVLAALSVALLSSARATPARSAATPAAIAKKLVGHWQGAKFAAEAQQFRSDRWDLVFQRASGPALIGKKRHQENGKWSAYEQIDAVVDSGGHIWAVDTDGTINGALRGRTLELIYLEAGTSDAAAARVRLTRR